MPLPVRDWAPCVPPASARAQLDQPEWYPRCACDLRRRLARAIDREAAAQPVAPAGVLGAACSAEVGDSPGIYQFSVDPPAIFAERAAEEVGSRGIVRPRSALFVRTAVHPMAKRARGPGSS